MEMQDQSFTLPDLRCEQILISHRPVVLGPEFADHMKKHGRPPEGSGWILPDGKSVSKENFPGLFEALNTEHPESRD